jgi:2,4-dienoyl-CoA reductase (NADPH2)
MTRDQIAETIAAFAAGARRAREAGLDGVELHAANGYLFTQFLSSAINDRTDDYGGPLPQRARFLLDVVAAIRAEVGTDFHLQVKISAEDHNDALDDDEKPGNTLDDTVQVCRWLDEAGVDAIHVSSGSYFPHPRNPAGDFPVDELVKTYDQLLSSGSQALRNYLLFRFEPTQRLFERRWAEARGDRIEGLNLPAAKVISAAVGVPVLCTGGFQTAEVIREAIRQQFCDAVTIARPLIANNDLVQQFAAGMGRPARPCTYCNRCLVNAVENPLGCYDETRYDSREAMLEQIMSVFSPAPFV